MLGAVVREHIVPEGGGLSRGPETQPHLGIATSPLLKFPEDAQQACREQRLGWAVWAADPRVVGPAGATVFGLHCPSRCLGEKAEPGFGMCRDWPGLVHGFHGSLVFLHVSMLCLCSASG